MQGRRSSKLGLLGWVCTAGVVVGCGGGAEDSPPLGQVTDSLVCGDASVTFTGCTEFAGIGVVPTSEARQLVPPNYALAGDESNAVIVVRVADCAGISVNGKRAKRGTVSQVGITLADGDPTADINNYTLWFGTTHGPLHAALRQRGVASELDANLSYDFTPDGAGGGQLSIVATPPQGPNYAVAGTAIVPVSPATSFIATWWSETAHGSVSMRTEFPAIQFSDATTVLSTNSGSALADLIGSTTLEFPILDSYNAFPQATLVIDVL